MKLPEFGNGSPAALSGATLDFVIKQLESLIRKERMDSKQGATREERFRMERLKPAVAALKSLKQARDWDKGFHKGDQIY